VGQRENKVGGQGSVCKNICFLDLYNNEAMLACDKY